MNDVEPEQDGDMQPGFIDGDVLQAINFLRI